MYICTHIRDLNDGREGDPLMIRPLPPIHSPSQARVTFIFNQRNIVNQRNHFTSIDIKIIRRSTNRIHKIIWWENLLLISGDLMRNGWRWTELCVPANSQDRHDTPLCAGVLAAWVKRQTFLFSSWRLHTWLSQDLWLFYKIFTKTAATNAKNTYNQWFNDNNSIRNDITAC